MSATLPDTLLPPTLDMDAPSPVANKTVSEQQQNYLLHSLSDNITDEHRVTSFTPSTDVCVGREPTCQLKFPACHQLSRLHCRIFSMGRDVFVNDLSSNGTFVNGQLVGKGNRRLLRNGDVVCCMNPKLPESVNYSWRFYNPNDESTVASPVSAGGDEISKHYCVGKVLGTGNFATVKLGTKHTTGQQVAIKFIEKKRFALAQDQFSFESLQHEVDILRKMQHENIISIHDVFDDHKHFTMVLELVPNGDFFDYIVGRCPNPFTEDEAKYLFIQLLEALLYMHSKEVVHRDLKPENILVKVNPDFKIPMKSDDQQHNAAQIPVDQVTLKITDFGLAKFCSEQSVMTTMCGTPSYLAPEVLTPSPAPNAGATRPGEAAKAAGYSWSVDVWSLGVILYIMLSGCPPKDPQHGVQFNKYFEKVTEEAKDIIKMMLKSNPVDRFDLLQICEHAWLKGCTIKQKHLAVGHEKLKFAPTMMIQASPTLAVGDSGLMSSGSASSGSNGISSSLASTAATVAATGGISLGGSSAPPQPAPPTATTSNGDNGNATDCDDDGDFSPAKRKKQEEVQKRQTIPHRVVWYWKKHLHMNDADAEAWQRYSDVDSEHIEKYHQKNAKSCKVGSTEDYRISFEGMFQYNKVDTSKQRPVKRVVE